MKMTLRNGITVMIARKKMMTKKLDFEILIGEKSMYEIWKYEDGKKIGMLGMINDLDRAIEIVNKLYSLYPESNDRD